MASVTFLLSINIIHYIYKDKIGILTLTLPINLKQNSCRYSLCIYQLIALSCHIKQNNQTNKKSNKVYCKNIITLLLLLLMGTMFSYFCMSSITSVLILAILIAIVLIHSY